MNTLTNAETLRRMNALRAAQNLAPLSEIPTAPVAIEPEAKATKKTRTERRTATGARGRKYGFVVVKAKLGGKPRRTVKPSGFDAVAFKASIGRELPPLEALPVSVEPSYDEDARLHLAVFGGHAGLVTARDRNGVNRQMTWFQAIERDSDGVDGDAEYAPHTPRLPFGRSGA